MPALAGWRPASDRCIPSPAYTGLSGNPPGTCRAGRPDNTDRERLVDSIFPLPLGCRSFCISFFAGLCCDGGVVLMINIFSRFRAFGACCSGPKNKIVVICGDLFPAVKTSYTRYTRCRRLLLCAYGATGANPALEILHFRPTEIFFLPFFEL